MRKSRPLYKIILAVVLLCIAAMLVVSVAPMLFQYHALGEMQATLGKMEDFTRYYSTLDELDELVGSYMNSGNELLRPQIEALLEKLKADNETMTEAFPHPRFVDNYYLTESYMEKAELILALGKDLSWEDRINYFVDYRKVYDYIMDNQRALIDVRSDLIEEAYEEELYEWRIQFIGMIALVIALSLALIIIATRLIRRLLKPIRTLTTWIKGYRPGERQEKSLFVDSGGVEETEILSSAFSDMIGQLEEKLETDKRNYELQVTLSETKMQLVQSMISPHFLFNCLATLAGMAYFENAPKTRALSLQIAGYLRDSLSLVGHDIPLQKELRHTKNYLDIQKARFQDRMEFIIENDGLSDELEVPAMILQPLAENSISHGIRDKLSGGEVRISVTTLEGLTRITVRDNGAGLDEEELEALRASIERPFEAGKGHIGLHSVATRLRDRGSVTLESRKNEYFAVIIELPR